MNIIPWSKSIRFYWKVIKESLIKFNEDDLLNQAAALSYYTIFSLPPMLLIVLFVASKFYDDFTVKAALFSQIAGLVGKEGAVQLQQTIEKITILEPTLWATILGGTILIFTSTTVFITLQNILNKIFRVKAKPHGWGIIKMIKDRALSFALLIGIAFILLVSLTLSALLESFGNFLSNSQNFSIAINLLTTVVLPFVIISILFAMMFKFLPDAQLEWSDTWFGAILTTCLFSAGKYFISFYIGNSNVATLYDAAGSVLIIMVWVFYASIIVMYGAVLTYIGLKIKGERIPATDYAVKVVYKEIEKEKISLDSSQKK